MVTSTKIGSLSNRCWWKELRLIKIIDLDTVYDADYAAE